MDMGGGNVSFAALFLMGLFGSLAHCLGMCVPLVMMAQARFSRGGRDVLAMALRYHGARIAVYAALGAIAGLAGAMVMAGLRLGGIAGLASILFGLAVIMFGLANLGVALPRPVQISGAWVVRPMRAALALPSGQGSLAAGALNGLLPCPLVYAALVMAAGLGSPLAGRMLRMDLANGSVRQLALQRDPQCPACAGMPQKDI